MNSIFFINHWLQFNQILFFIFLLCSKTSYSIGFIYRRQCAWVYSLVSRIKIVII
uniref:Uncharacterized protein n=1 Tax=Siphoviridae sp. ctLqe90 TaxID=2825456 RepID=A0A8S5Q3P8_9CAUD|nr:MAG TPA: hypothetical protein [Siphoviridae sp. ctLqe90]